VDLERTRSGVLVVRAWYEDDEAGSFRARIVARLDLEHSGDVYERVAASPDQVRAAVSDWLQRFAAFEG
jgi:hypothetical protein